jgi:hypothetical protein
MLDKSPFQLVASRATGCRGALSNLLLVNHYRQDNRIGFSRRSHR